MRMIDVYEFDKLIDYGHLNNPDEKLYSENDIREMIDMMPTIDAEPVKHGKWIPDKTGNSYWICTKCGFPSEASDAFVLYHYCPQCGAKMDELQESKVQDENNN